jgi:Tfp pilus assembly protein PilN
VAIKLNLANKPFTNRVLPWLLTVVVVFFSLLGLVFIVRATGQANEAARAVQKDNGTLHEQERAQTLVLEKQANAVKGALTAEQLRTLSSAHELIGRKEFSWSRLFADLESALPGGVRVSRISVRDVATQGSQTLAALDLVVVAKTPSTVTDMIAAMDRLGIFQAEIRAQNLQKGRGQGGTEYELYVLYRPRAGASSPESQPTEIASVPPAPKSVPSAPPTSEGGAR